MPDVLVMLLQFLLGMSLIVLIHEMGHMLMAKWCGMRVTHFHIGFPPILAEKRIGQTRYGIGLLPLGGAVQIAGMLDESLDTAHMAEPVQPWEFRAKAPWQRLLVLLGGVGFNVISAILIYAGISKYQGEVHLSKQGLNTHGIYPSAMGEALGFRAADRIEALNGQDFLYAESLLDPKVFLAENLAYTVYRNGKHLEITIDLEKHTQALLQAKEPLFTPLVPFSLNGICPQSPAEKAGLQPGDIICSIDGVPTRYLQQLQAVLHKKPDHVPVVVHVLRNAKPLQLTCIPHNHTLGLILKADTSQYTFTSLGFVASLHKGCTKAYRVLEGNVMGFAKLFSGRIHPKKALSGPVGIAQLFGSQFTWLRFLHIIAMLSLAIAFMNVLPIPALDGGHVVWVLYEMLTGKKPSSRVLMVSQAIGMGVLLLLFVLLTYNDIAKILGR